MKKTLSRTISLLLTLAMVISLLAVPVSAATWDNVSETRYASRYVTSNYTTGKFYDNVTKIPLTGDGRRDVVAVAASQVGYIEGSSSSGYNGEVGGSNNYTEYGCFLGLTGGSGHAWCAAFCAWSFYVAEVTDLQGSQYDTEYGNIWADAYVPYWSEYLIEQGRYKAAYQFRNSYSYLYDASYVPQPGDLVFFYTASGDYPGWEGHIGLVAYSDGTYVYTLEGNTSSQDGVESEGGGAFFKKYDLKGSSLVGFGSMPYETVAGLPEIDYTGANPTPGLYVTTSGAKSVYQNINDSTASWTLPMSSVFEVLDIANDSDGNVMLYSKCEINGSTVYGWITHGSDYNGYTKTLQIYASGEVKEDPNDLDRDGIPDSYGVTIESDGTRVFDNCYGFTFKINDTNGTIDGEDATLITTASAYNSCNPNWAISVQLRPTGNASEYEVVKVVECPGSAAAAGISLQSGDVILVVHSADSQPGIYANWMSKVAAVALKEGDILTFNASNTTATVSQGETVEPTEPEVTEPEVTEPEVTEPEVTEPEVTEPAIEVPDYGGKIPGAGLQGYAGNLYYGVDISYHNVNDQSYHNYETDDDSGADYSLLDFKAMKASGLDYVIIRIGSIDSYGIFYDPHFITMYNMAREAGMDVGAYFYSHALTYAEAVEEAEFCIDVIEKNGMYFEYPIYIDIEEEDQLALSSTELDAIAYGWCDTMVDNGYFPGIYTGYYASQTMGAQLQKDYDMWIAAYGSTTPANDSLSDICSMWQYTSTGTGGFNGIGKDDIDLNVCYKDYPAIIAAGGYNNINGSGSNPGTPDVDDDDTNPDKDGDGIPDSYGVSVNEKGIYSFENSYGYTFAIDDVNGTIDGEDATIITTSSKYSSCNPNWAISVHLRLTGTSADEYEVVKVVECPGSASAAGISLQSGDVILVVHSAASYPGAYANWMSKVAAVALKEGDIIEIASDNKSATVIGPAEVEEPEIPDVTEPEPTEPEVTEPEVTEPEVTEPEVTEPEVTEPEVTEPEVTEPEVTEPEVTEPADPDADGDGILDCYGVSVNEKGIYSFENSYGYTFAIDDVNGTIDGEDATIITTSSKYNSCNPNWAISVHLRLTGTSADEYEVVKVVECPGSASAAGISLQSGDVILVVHSAASYPGAYANWMSKIAAVALKEGDIIEIATDNKSATVIGPAEVEEPEIPDVTEPEVTEPEVTEPEITEPEVTEPEVTEPEVTEPEVTEPEVTEPADPDADGDGILDCYGVYVEDGIYAFTNSYGYVFDIDDVNGTIEGEDATIITTAAKFSSCNPNWAISVQLRPTVDGKYQVVKVVECPGSASAAGISLQSGDVIMVVHSAASFPGAYANWMDKIAAVALKKGDIVEIASDNKTVTVISEGVLEETEEPEVIVPDANIPNYGGAIAGAGIPGSASNLYYGCDVSFYNVSDNSYANYTTSDDSGANYSLLDFKKMKADGCDFVILRMGSSDSYGYYTDPHFFTLYNMAREAGMDIGLYFYSYAMSESEAIAEAKYVISVLDANNMYFEYPIYIDIEESDQLSLGQTTLSNICYGWCETLVDAGYYPGVYGNYNLYDAVSAQVKADYDFWVAWVSSATSQSAYNPSTHNISNEASMWQYSFYGYEYDGVGLSMLDVNVSYKDYPAIMRTYGYNNVK